MSKKDTLMDPNARMESAMTHFAIDTTKDCPHAIFPTSQFPEYALPLKGVADFSKKFQAVIDYDPEYEWVFIRILSDRIQ